MKSEPLSLTHSNRPIFVWGFLLPYFFLEETTTTSQDIMQISKVPLKWKFSNTTSSRSLSKNSLKAFHEKKEPLRMLSVRVSEDATVLKGHAYCSEKSLFFSSTF